mgnify:FL=1
MKKLKHGGPLGRKRPDMKYRTWFLIMLSIAIISTLILYFFDWPVEGIGAFGYALVVISCFESFRRAKGWRAKN